MGTTDKPAGAKPSKVELTKLASQYLKTFVADELASGTSHFSEDAATILKFHGSYQQDDRDLRKQLKKEGKETGATSSWCGCESSAEACPPISIWRATTWRRPSATAACGSPPGRNFSSTASEDKT